MGINEGPWETWRVDLSARMASAVQMGGKAVCEQYAAELNHQGTTLIGAHFRYLYVAMPIGGAPFDDPDIIKACDDFADGGRQAHAGADGGDAAAARALAGQMTAWLEAPCSETNPMYPTPGADLERWCRAARDLLERFGGQS